MFLLPTPSSYLDHVVFHAVEEAVRGERLPARGKALRSARTQIVNESAIGCGDNVGGSATASSAPEVATGGCDAGGCDAGGRDGDGGGDGGDDGDGDGDGDPDPERRPKRRCTSSTRNTLPPAQLSRP